MTMASWVIMGLWLVVMAIPIIKSQLITPEGCGTTKGCFRSPENCASPSTCSFFLSWTLNGSSNIFEMSGNVGTYVAVGFSKSGRMMDSDVYACTRDLQVVRQRNLDEDEAQGPDLAHATEPRPLKGVSEADVSIIDGRIECRFKRQMSSGDNDETYYDLSAGNNYHIIMAKSGINLNEDGSVKFHYGGRVAGPRRSFTTYDEAEAPPPPPSGDCSVATGCFRSPRGCGDAGDPCDFEVIWRKNSDGSLRFDMSGNAESYVALGFSKSGGMDNSDVYACTNNTEIVRSRNTVERQTNDKNQSLKGVSDVSVTVENGRIECSFIRQASLNDNDDTFYDLGPGNSYTLIMSKSNSFLWEDGNIMYHFGGKVIGPIVSLSDAAPPPNMMPESGDCGTSRGCFMEPQSCTGPADCEFYVSWLINDKNDHVFQLSAKASTYVALGFSKSGKMMDSDVYACTRNKEVVRSRNTKGNTNDKNQELKGVSDVSVSVVDGRIECSFTRQASLVGDDTYYDLRNPNKYTIIMARSNGVLLPDGNIMYHGSRVQGAKVSFNDFSVSKASKDNSRLLLKAHGCLMIIAWLGFASIGLTIARYMKPIAPETKLCDDKPVWFAVHRFVMVMAFICTVAAFIIVFVKVGGFVDPSGQGGVDTRYIHAILGTIVTCLAIINPIMAIFRPHPGTPRRPIFNWAHWGVGTGAHLIGMATISFALVNVGKAKPLIQGLPAFLFWLLVIFVVAHVMTWIMMELRSRCFKNTGSTDNIPLKGGADDGEPGLTTATKKADKFMNMTYFLYVVVVLIVTAVLVIVIITNK